MSSPVALAEEVPSGRESSSVTLIPGGGDSSSVAASPTSTVRPPPDAWTDACRRMVFAHTFWISLALLVFGGLVVWGIAPDMFDRRVATSSGALNGALVVWYLVLLVQVQFVYWAQAPGLLLFAGHADVFWFSLFTARSL
jgi:hypothetical protein